MDKIFCLANQKGGVGKTTSCICLATAFAEKGHKILAIDLDPHAGLTTHLGYNPDNFDKTIYNVLVNSEDTPITEVIYKTKIPTILFVPSNIDLAGAEAELIGEINWATILKESINTIKNEFDYILLDCPPNLGVLTTNALMSTDMIIIPMQCEYLAMRGLKKLQDIIDKVKKRGNANLKYKILRTMHDKRTLHSREVYEEIESIFRNQVFRSAINRTIKFADSVSSGNSILITNSDSEGAIAYRELAKEILNYE